MVTRFLVIVTLVIFLTISLIILRLPPSTLNFIAYTLLFLFSLSAIGALLFFSLAAKERLLTLRANRQKIEREAKHSKYKVIQDGFGMSHLLNIDTDIIENLSAFPGTHHNGKWEEPHPAAAAAWHALISKRSTDSPVTHLLPPPPQDTPIDLLKVMTQPTQSYAILGGQQQGKTYQAQLIAQYWQQQGVEVVVIGPKRDKGEWPGCVYYGDGYNMEEVLEGIFKVKEEASKRHQNQEKGHKQHAIMPVFFDDWTNTMAELSNEAEELILRATTLYASVNIIVYFIIHLDTAKAWGVSKFGAALKDNFIKLRIKPYYQGGIAIKEKATGLLIFPGDKEKKEVELLRPQYQVIMSSPEERRVIELHQAGLSKSAIARRVFGGDGGNQLKKVERILNNG